MFKHPCSSGIYMIRNQVTGRCYIGTAHFAVNGTGAFYGAIGA